MKKIKAVSMKDYEYRAERSQEKKQARSLRDQKKGRKGQWTNIVGYD